MKPWIKRWLLIGGICLLVTVIVFIVISFYKDDFTDMGDKIFSKRKSVQEIKIDEYTKRIEEDPDNYYLYYYRGRLYSNFKDHSKKLADYAKAIELNPEATEVYGSRSLFYFIKGNASENDAEKNDYYDLALKDINRCIELKPENAYYYEGRAEILNKMGKFDEALAELNKALELGYPERDAREFRAGIFLNMEDYDNYLENIIVELDLTGENKSNRKPKAYLKNAEVLVDAGEYDKAILLYDKMIEKFTNPLYSWIHVEKGKALEQAEKIEEALKAYNDFMAIEDEKDDSKRDHDRIEFVEKQIKDLKRRNNGK